MSSPLDLPELLSLVASHLERGDLARACQVSVLFHNACTPILWRTISLVGRRAGRVWSRNAGFRQGLTHYGPFVRTIRLDVSHFEDKDMELVAINCTRLKSFELSSYYVTVETLKVLLHSDPYKTLSASTVIPEDNDPVDPKARMEQYRSMSETETGQEDGHRLYESVGLPASSRVRLIMPGHKTESQGGANRPAGSKGTMAQFPFHLEELSLAKCSKLSGSKLFPLLSLLGPQLRRLSVDYIRDLEGLSYFIQLMKHCPNLTRLSLAGMRVDDDFLAALSGATKDLAPRAMEALNLHYKQASVNCLAPLIKASRDKLSQLTFSDNRDIRDDVIYAFIEDTMEANKVSCPVKSY
ncbi:hypothetical protein BGZ98_005261, partial [Dissophora globulifera]